MSNELSRFGDILRADAHPEKTVDGIPVFLSAAREREMQIVQETTIENSWKNFFKQWPKLYKVLVFFIAPSYFNRLTPRKFLKKYVPEGAVLNAGSGVDPIAGQCLNVDLFPFAGVDLVADLTELPFRDAVFAGVISEQVLEHVEYPQRVAKELMRVTKAGGYIRIASPFLFPWHPSPSDFTRWTVEGLRTLFPDCDFVEGGVTAGPWSAFTAFMAAFLATILCFGSRSLQGVLQYIFLILLFPLKFLDAIFAYLPASELCAANFYIVVRKR